MGKANPAISIIVPTYNVEKYITYCMDSLLGQTLKDFEVIIVDDVSEDKTYEICQKLYADLECVTLIKNPVNKGQWYARNMGIIHAKGKYIYFMDDDDELLPNALETLYNKAEEEQADVVHTNLYALVYSEERMLPRKSIWKRSRCQDTGEGLLTGTLPERLHYQAATSMPMPWLNLFRREFLVREGIEFPPMVYGEDNVFAIDVCLKAKKFIRINELLYLYRSYFDQKGRMVGRFPKLFDYVPIFLKGYNRIFDNFSEKELPYENRRSFITSWLMAHLRFGVFEIVNSDEKDAFSSIKENLNGLCSEGDEFTAHLINLLEHAYGFYERIPAERAQKRESVKKFFQDLSRGRSEFCRDYGYIYTEAKLASYIEGGENDFYRQAYEYMADAALNLCKYQEALCAYDAGLKYVSKGSESCWQLIAGKMMTLSNMKDTQDELLSAYDVCKDCMAGIMPYSYEDYQGRSKKKLRVGLLFASRPADWFALYYGLLFACEKDGFEIYCYYCVDNDGYAEFIRTGVAKLVDIRGLSCAETAKAIHEDGVDVLIDFTGNSAYSFLPVIAHRPAPVQIAGIERLSVAGSDMIDCFLTDDVISPQKNSDSGNADLFYLPCRYSYAMRNDVPASSGAPALRNKCVNLGIFAKYSQITDDMLAVWRDIMAKLPEARLLMNVDEFSEPAMIVEASERMSAMGFDIHRVDFEGIADDPMTKYPDVDILLGTYPAMDSVRILDALYMGVPMIAMYGQRRDTKSGLSILKRAKLEEFSVDNSQDYIAKAVALARDFDKLDTLHKELRGRLQSATELRPVKWARKLETKIRELVYMR